MVSIVLPVYNVVSYLDRCMASLLAQTYRKLEIIMIDDGSTDGSGELCDWYGAKDARVRVIHQANKGLSEARNIGTRESRGKYICYVDSDDRVEEKYVEVLHDILVKSKASMVMCAHYQVSDKEGTILPQYPYNMEGKDCSKFFTITSKEYVYNYVNRKSASATAWDRMYTAELAHLVSWPEGRVYEDRAMHIRIAQSADKIAVIGIPLYYYYKQRANSITCNSSMKNLKDYWWATETMHKDIVDYAPELEKNIGWVIAETAIFILKRMNEEKKYKNNRPFIRLMKRKVLESLVNGSYRDLKSFGEAVFVLLFSEHLNTFRSIYYKFKK